MFGLQLSAILQHGGPGFVPHEIPCSFMEIPRSSPHGISWSFQEIPWSLHGKFPHEIPCGINRDAILQNSQMIAFLYNCYHDVFQVVQLWCKTFCLHCFVTVDWASGRASNLRHLLLISQESQKVLSDMYED